ncbi:MAG: 30S ribosomal protein S20 [Kiritimatiellae bacterium]|nr:30S ribosomal protein S20 [Kiritimatiellia bacterium]MDW8458999.1 30S ribosomal protein S20 [Verrucomicrobiota bacterium]
MAHTKQALKRHRQSEEDRLRNRAGRSVIKTFQTKLTTAIAAKDAVRAGEMFSRYCSALDKAVKKGIIKKNAAIRKKTRAANRLRSLASA